MQKRDVTFKMLYLLLFALNLSPISPRHLILHPHVIILSYRLMLLAGKLIQLRYRQPVFIVPGCPKRAAPPTVAQGVPQPQRLSAYLPSFTVLSHVVNP